MVIISMQSAYLATPWLSSPHLQTAFLSFHEGLLLLLIDGDKTPIVIVIPGLTSDSTAAYVKHRAFNMARQGWSVVVCNHRGLGGVSLTSDCCYNAGWTEDVRKIIDHIRFSLAGGKPAAIGHRTPPPTTAAGHRNGGRNSPKTPPKRRSKRPKTDSGSMVAFIATTVYSSDRSDLASLVRQLASGKLDEVGVVEAAASAATGWTIWHQRVGRRGGFRGGAASGNGWLLGLETLGFSIWNPFGPLDLARSNG
ncbi:Serine/threonine-protein kinase PBS1 [Hibiscus syriacus]|uniref:Serine/threonine-protein kinase PBS1 n=1 Tax=Hibiscus syriacus TaxID=106335 RepID=A0A6A2Z934_HIBSY|nr:Serine/threonine-protein kinase PBS1 [Hibiscus syriacus]